MPKHSKTSITQKICGAVRTDSLQRFAQECRDACLMVVRGPCKRECGQAKPHPTCEHAIDKIRRNANSRISIVYCFAYYRICGLDAELEDCEFLKRARDFVECTCEHGFANAAGANVCFD